MRLLLKASLTATLLFAIASIAQQVPSPAVSPLPPVPGKIFTVTEQPGYHNEPTIAVNARNPQQAFAAYQAHATVVYSQDGGATWKTATGTASTDYGVSGDVASTYDKKGAAILCYISFDRLGTMNYWARGATRNGVFLAAQPMAARASWDKQDHAVIAQPTKPGIPFEDKPGIAADNTDSPYAGNLYVGWTEFRIDESVILFGRSTNGGVTWSTPRVGNITGYRATTTVRLRASRRRSARMERFSGLGRRRLAGFCGIARRRQDVRQEPAASSIRRRCTLTCEGHVERAKGDPQIGIDTHHGDHGRLYVIWSDYRSGDIRVYTATSEDGGATWSGATRVNSNPPHDGTDQFFPWLSVDPVTGVPNIIFYDRRADAHNRNTTVTLARSTDGGVTWTNYAWTSEPFASSEMQFLGDYIGVAALNDKESRGVDGSARAGAVEG